MSNTQRPQIVLTEQELKALAEYSHTNPTGTTIGKRWKRRVAEDKFIVCEYYDINDPDKVGIRYYDVVMATVKRYVIGLLFSPDGSKVLLIKKLRPLWQAGALNAIGGKIEKHEQPLEAMQREFQEEAGLVIDSWQPFVKLFRPDEYEVYCYVARSKYYTDFESKTDEVVDVHEVATLDYDKLIPNLRWLIPMALDPYVGKGSFIHVEDVGGN